MAAGVGRAAGAVGVTGPGATGAGRAEWPEPLECRPPLA